MTAYVIILKAKRSFCQKQTPSDSIYTAQKMASESLLHT